MNTATVILKRIDLLSFITQSEASEASLRVADTPRGTLTGVISFPACGNWVNKFISQPTPRHGEDAATGLQRLLQAR